MRICHLVILQLTFWWPCLTDFPQNIHFGLEDQDLAIQMTPADIPQISPKMRRKQRKDYRISNVSLTEKTSSCRFSSNSKRKSNYGKSFVCKTRGTFRWCFCIKFDWGVWSMVLSKINFLLTVHTGPCSSFRKSANWMILSFSICFCSFCFKMVSISNCKFNLIAEMWWE